MKIDIECRKKRGVKPGTVRPNIWKSGPDPEIHKHYRPYVQQRNQATWRNELWDVDFTFEKWIEFWGDKLQLRGRKVGQYIMIRLDSSMPWSLDNIELMFNSGERPNRKKTATEIATNNKDIKCSITATPNKLHIATAKLGPTHNIR